MAEFNIPIQYSNGTNLTGMINFSYPTGNQINAKWGRISNTGITEDNEWTLYWNFINVHGTLMQDDESLGKGYNVSGKYYPDGRSYGYTIDFDSDLLEANLYSLKIVDTQNMFDINKKDWRPKSIILNIDSFEVDKPTNISKTGTEIFNSITINYEMVSNNTIEYQIIEDGIVKVNVTNHTGRSIVIPPGIFTSNSSTSLRIRSKVSFLDVLYYSEWVSYTISGLSSLEAEKPDNVRVVGTERSIEEGLVIAWDIDNDIGTKYLFEIWQYGKVIKSYSNLLTNSFTIPAGTIKDIDDVSVRVKSFKSINGYNAESEWASLNLNDLTSIKPILSDFTLDSLNRDYDINITVTGSGHTSNSVNGVSGLTILKGTLITGLNTITVTSFATASSGIVTSTSLSKQFEMVEDVPEIFSLEPDDININISHEVPITFVTNDFVDTFELKYLNQTIHGTTARRHVVASNVFSKSMNEISLVATYKPTYQGASTRIITKKVAFTGFGIPNTPIFNQSTVYSTPTPLIIWDANIQTDSDEQTGYRFIIRKLDGTVIEDVTKTSSDKKHQMVKELENNTEYIIELSIQNKYFLWSNAVTRRVETSFSVLPIPDFDLYDNGNGVLISTNLEGVLPSDFKELVVFRRENDDFVKLADKLIPVDSVLDTSLRTRVPVEYKVRLYNESGAFSESDTKSITLERAAYTFAVPPRLENPIEIQYISSSISYVKNKKSRLFANARAPKIYEDKVDYAVATLTVTLPTVNVKAFVDLLDNPIILYRDLRGNKFYCNGTVNSKMAVNRRLDQLKVTLIEVEYDETLMFSADSLRQVLLLDGSRLLDGNTFLRGVAE